MGFICKDEQSDTLILAIRLIMRGEVFISPKMATALFRANQDNGHTPLNPRQMQVVRLMAAYLSPQEIAMEMDVTTQSVYSLQYRIRQILNLKTTAQILIEAMKRGWIKEDN